MEFIIGLITGFALTWPALVVLLVLGIIFEANNSHGWAKFTAITLAVIAYFYFAIPASTMAFGSAIYIVVGFIWAVWRYKRFVDGVVAQYADRSEKDREYAISSMSPKNRLSSIVNWVIVWPFSMIENVTSDFVSLIKFAITDLFNNIYNSIFQAGVSKLRNVPATDKDAV